MAVVFSDNFDSYSNGVLVGQGGWTGVAVAGPPGYNSYVVEGTVVQAGAKAITFPNNVNGTGAVTHTFTATGGNPILSIYARNDTAASYGIYFYAMDGSSQGWTVRMVGGGTWDIFNIPAFALSASVPGAWVANTWYKIEIEVDCANDQARGRIDGGTWSSFVSNALFGTQVSAVEINQGTNLAGTSYADTLSVDDGVVTGSSFISSLLILGVG